MMPEYADAEIRAYAQEQMAKHKELCRLRRLGELPKLDVEYSPLEQPKPTKRKDNGYRPNDKVTVGCSGCGTERQITRSYYEYQYNPGTVCNKCKRRSNLKAQDNREAK